MGHFLESTQSLDRTCSFLLPPLYIVCRELPRAIIYAYCDYPDRPRSLGQKLRRMRLDLRLHIKEVAAAVGVCEATMINWERRDVVPSPELLHRVREFYQSRGHSLAGRL